MQGTILYQIKSSLIDHRFIHISGCPSGWMSVDNRCLCKSSSGVKSNQGGATNVCKQVNGWLASINTKDIYATVQLFSHEVGRYWIGSTDLAKEGTNIWEHGEEWKFSPPWHPGQPGDGTPDGESNRTRDGQNCFTLDETHGMHDDDCKSTFAYMCMTHKVQVGLGGQVEGYNVDHGGHCDQGAKYEIDRTIDIGDLGLSSEYITTFLPSGYLKLWAR